MLWTLTEISIIIFKNCQIGFRKKKHVCKVPIWVISITLKLFSQKIVCNLQSIIYKITHPPKKYT